MKTVKMTRAELRNAIAELRGWRETIDSDGSRWIDGPQGEIDKDLPDYLGDMNEAIILFRELPGADLFYTPSKGDVICFFADHSSGKSGSCFASINDEAHAIAAAWYQFTTGIRVEVSE